VRRALAIALLFATTAAHAATYTVDDYVDALRRWRTQLATNQIAQARTDAARFRDAEVVWSGGRFRTDASLINAVQTAQYADFALMERLDVTARELQLSGAVGPAPDPKLLQQVAAEQKIPELAPGGKVKTTFEGESTILEDIAEWIRDAWAWLARIVSDILEWFFRTFFELGIPVETPGMRWLVIGATILIALMIVVIAVQVVRRARRGKRGDVIASEPIASRRDDDPLSRAASEWERYAAQLAASGRFREAIRAWYHAVLVTSYNTGVLHFRKGRTNWEYVATLAPSLAWRPEMIELTRRFEQEWYGADQSTPDALEHCSERAQRILTAMRGVA
jgi:hypothetical protein